MPPKDNNKKARDLSLDSTIEEKLLNSLHASMLFFVFDNICLFLAEEAGASDELAVHKDFFK